MGDFATLQDLPDMYRHCKATEDKDMGPIDFITDHLVNIDGLFDKHDNGDEQKPHEPTHTQNQEQSTVFCVSDFTFSLKQFHPIEVKPSISSDKFLPSDYISEVFRPPVG